MRFSELFGGKKPVMAMVHMKGDAEMSAFERAKREIGIYAACGVEAVVVENYFGSVRDCEAALDWLAQQRLPGLVYGLNILGDSELAFGLAKKYAAAFVQIDSVCGHLSPGEDEKYAARLAELRAGLDVVLLGGVRFKYQPVCSGRSEEEDLRLGMERCDAIVVTGSGTGVATPHEKLLRFREAVGGFPLVVGAGCTPETLGETFADGDGAIVGSWFKQGHRDVGDVVPEYVEQFMREKRRVCP